MIPEPWTDGTFIFDPDKPHFAKLVHSINIDATVLFFPVSPKDTNNELGLTDFVLQI